MANYTVYPPLIHKIGDVVTVRQDLEAGKVYNGVRAVNEMEIWRGKGLTIAKLEKSELAGIPYYRTEEDLWLWSDPMFEDEACEPISLDLTSVL